MTGLLVHEWIEPTGGAEQVLDAFADLFPSAHIACLWNDAPERYRGRKVIESRLATSRAGRNKVLRSPQMSQIWRSFDTSGYDWVLVSSYVFAHHVGSVDGRRERPTYVYAHSPARFLYSPEADPRAKSLLARVGGHTLRAVDKKYSGAQAKYATNSQFVAERALSAWEILPEVIYPPIRDFSESDRLSRGELQLLRSLPSQFILGASRFVPYKRLDVVAEFARNVGLPVVIAGRGPNEDLLEEKLGAMSRGTLVRSPSDALLAELFRRALVYVFPPVEDLGLMPIEALSVGTPVIVNSLGGAKEVLIRAGGGVACPISDLLSSESASARLNEALSAPRMPLEEWRSYYGVDRFRADIIEWMA